MNPPIPPQPVHYVPVQNYVPRQTSGLAVASLVLGIFSFVGGAAFIIPPLLAIIFGHIALSNCKRDPNLDGSGLAVAGLVLGYILIALGIAIIIFFGGFLALILSFI